VKEIQAKMWTADEIQDNRDPLIIYLGDDSSTDESSPSEESGDDTTDVTQPLQAVITSGKFYTCYFKNNHYVKLKNLDLKCGVACENA
jgi:hypothetical protein